MKITNNSKRFKINWRNILRGGLYSATSASALILTNITQLSDLSFQKIATVFLCTFFGYILPKFFQNEHGNYTNKVEDK